MGDERGQRLSRRRMLELVGTGGAMGIAGCEQLQSNQTTSPTPSSTQTNTRTDTPTEGKREKETTNEEPGAWEVNPLDHDKLIGAHYYVWYNSDPGWENWLERIPGTPVLGEYSSSEPDVVNQHVKWALEHGINWFNISWWGPESDENLIALVA